MTTTVFWLAQAHGQVLRGEASMEKALEDAQQRLDDFRMCIVARDVGDDEEGMIACLVEIDPPLANLFED